MGRQYLQSVALVFLLVIMTILIARYDRAAAPRVRARQDGHARDSFSKMASLHIPFMAQKALPFIVLVGGIVTFAKMTRSPRARDRAGGGRLGLAVPVARALAIAVLLGGLFMTVINPPRLCHDIAL